MFLDQNLNKNFLCPLGKGVMNKPMMDGCGHQYCEYCLRMMLENNMDCKVSEQPIKKPQKFVENLLASKLISNLKIKCINYKNGCDWKGKLSELSEHLLQKCMYQEVKCPKEHCQERIQRKDLEKHQKECQYRVINCPECNEEIIYLNKQKHEDECPKKDIQCPQQCGQIIKRKNIQNHLKNFCKNLTIHCPYHTCKVQGDRKSVQEHVFSKNGFIHHQNLLSDKVVNIEQKLNLVNSFINSLRIQMQQQAKKHQRIQESMDKFYPFSQSDAIFINEKSNKAMKMKMQGPTFVLINSSFQIDKTFLFRINCQSSLGIGLSNSQVVIQKNFIFDESKVIDHTYLFKITSQMGREDIYLELSMLEDNQQTSMLALKNLNNQSLTKLFIPKNEKADLCPVLILNNIGDSAEILQPHQDESEHDFFNDDKKLSFSRTNSTNQQQLIQYQQNKCIKIEFNYSQKKQN